MVCLLVCLITLDDFDAYCSALAAGSTRSLSVRGGVSLGVESQQQFRGFRSVVVSGCGTLQRQCETNLAELSNLKMQHFQHFRHVPLSAFGTLLHSHYRSCY